ncbi:MAG: xanthine dehydrogenase family protein molybdopterin-binding subunit [Alphaproteobacteria bacterium]|nr:xanthine dehydrogenase family protein molybdopterin-binding subunit [Alphaproteobacteria bacterium]
MGQFGISQPVLRREDDKLLRGKGRFIDDLAPDGVVHGYVLRSPHGHARIVDLDVTLARAAPGVLAVYSAADLAAAGIGPIQPIAIPNPRPGSTFQSRPQPILAADSVQYVGDSVAFVVAETLEQAQDAAELIEVEYQPLKAVVGCDNADGAGGAGAAEEDNLSFAWEMGDGAAVAQAFATAHHRTSLDLVNNRVVLAAIETRGAVAEYDATAFSGRGKFTLTTTTQMPNIICEQLANEVFQVNREQVRVLVHDVGGGFGGKNSLFPEYPLCLLAARELGRPVKWIGQRADAFITDFHGRDNVMRGEMAFDDQGHLLAIRVASQADLGAYTAGRGVLSPVNGMVMLSNCYRIPHVYAEVWARHTNTVPTDPYRGAGRPEVLFMIERLMDVAAGEMNIDRVELRRRNLIPPEDFPYATPTGLNYDLCDFAKVIDGVMAKADWPGFEARRQAAQERGRLRGIGMANYIERCGGGAGLSEAARLEFDAEGGVTVYSGSMANGQAHETAFSQILHHYFDLPFDKIRVVEGDTDVIATGAGTGGSWSIPMGGGAISLASEQVIEKAKRIAAHLLETSAGDLEFADGQFKVAGTDLQISWSEVVRASRDPGQLPSGEEPGLDTEARFTPENFTFPYGCHIAEVEVDPDTGAVELVAYSCMHDFGVVLNPLLLAGQVQGGLAQGIGQALMEHTAYDDEGQLLAGSFMDYRLPRADDLPDLNFAAQVTPSPQNLLGIKGCGEAGAAGSPPAVINALVDALRGHGIRHIDMPATSERVWSAIQSAAMVRPDLAG